MPFKIVSQKQLYRDAKCVYLCNHGVGGLLTTCPYADSRCFIGNARDVRVPYFHVVAVFAGAVFHFKDKVAVMKN